MHKAKSTRSGERLTALILEIFRLHGELLAAGDRLVEPLGLTSARWQVLGAVHLASTPQTVPEIAGAMGLTRQAVQKQIDLVLGDGLVELEDNPAHRRSPRVALSRGGRNRYQAAELRQIEWAKRLAESLSLADLETASRVLRELTNQLARSQERPNTRRDEQ